MSEGTSPRRSSGRTALLLPIGLAIVAVLVVAVLFRFGTDGSTPPMAEPDASLTLTDPAESSDLPSRTSSESPPPDDAATAVSDADEAAGDTALAGTATDAADTVSDTATATEVVATAAGDVSDTVSSETAADVELAVVEPDTAVSGSPSPDTEPDLAAAAPMIDIDAPDLQGLAELATLTTLPDAVDETELPSVADPVAGDLFGSPVMLVSSAMPRVVVLANGTSLVPGATLPSGHRLVAIERERILLERDGVEWRLRVP